MGFLFIVSLMTGFDESNFSLDQILLSRASFILKKRGSGVGGEHVPSLPPGVRR